MRQRTILLQTLPLLLACAAFGTLPATAPTPPPAATPKITVASLVPSATDLILAAGLRDQLLAVSNFCRSNPAAATLPAVGDYETIDWEKITALHPDLMLVFKARDRLPPGLVDRATAQQITLEVVKVETVADVKSTLARLGNLLHHPEATAALSARIDAQLAAIQKAVAGQTKPRTLLVVGSSNLMLIGPDTFLDELLTLAGGTNAAQKFTTRYPTIDEETLLTLKPDKVIVLLPNATPAEVRDARTQWARRLGDSKKFTLLTDWYLLLPGSHLGDTAAALARALHPDLQSDLPPSNPGSQTPTTERPVPNPQKGAP